MYDVKEDNFCFESIRIMYYIQESKSKCKWLYLSFFIMNYLKYKTRKYGHTELLLNVINILKFKLLQHDENNK